MHRVLISCLGVLFYPAQTSMNAVNQVVFVTSHSCDFLRLVLRTILYDPFSSEWSKRCRPPVRFQVTGKVGLHR
jgi:hypothetical protein